MTAAGDTLPARVAALSPGDRAELYALWARRGALDLHAELRPADLYEPHAAGQEQFHRAPHVTRCLWPGNGFGKTRAMGSEVAWWIYHCHPYQRTPKWPTIGIWACETYKQFDILTEQLVTDCFGPARSRRNPRGWAFNKSDKMFRWPSGDKLYLVSGDSSWTAIQGINPDYFAFDEEPPKALFNEAKMRRRGRRKTRYMFAATATQGLTWMYRELYLPWLKHHQDAGLTADAAHDVQSHPLVWAWAKGGISDNPGCDPEDTAFYAAQTFSSDAERQVRLFGGFADFSGKPVFNLTALERMRPGLTPGEDGWLAAVGGVSERVAGRRFEFVAGATDPAGRGRVTVFERPDTARHKYVIGHDSAYGLEEGDFDYAVVLDRNTGRQVAEAQGRWGDATWATVLHALYWFYGDAERGVGAFLCGERQVGLLTMRRLMDEMGVGYQFFDKDEAKRAPRRSDTLGHHRRAGDLTIGRLRKMIGAIDLAGTLLPSELSVASPELHRQMTKYQFRPRSSTVDVSDARDAQLTTGGPDGDHDDGVMALAYAAMGLREVDRFEEARASYREGTYGAAFNMADELGGREQPPAPDPFGRD